MKRIRCIADRVRRFLGIPLPERCQCCGIETSFCCSYCKELVPVCMDCACPKCGVKAEGGR